MTDCTHELKTQNSTSGMIKLEEWKKSEVNTRVLEVFLKRWIDHLYIFCARRSRDPKNNDV
jgi:hypothetical protein